LTAIDRLYEAVREQHGIDCLDRLIAEADGDALEECLLGFFAQLRNEAVIENAESRCRTVKECKPSPISAFRMALDIFRLLFYRPPPALK
jgi:hypothetical protein